MTYRRKKFYCWPYCLAFFLFISTFNIGFFLGTVLVICMIVVGLIISINGSKEQAPRFPVAGLIMGFLIVALFFSTAEYISRLFLVPGEVAYYIERRNTETMTGITWLLVLGSIVLVLVLAWLVYEVREHKKRVAVHSHHSPGRVTGWFEAFDDLDNLVGRMPSRPAANRYDNLPGSAPTVQDTRCPSCNTPAHPDDRFCQSCGVQLKQFVP